MIDFALTDDMTRAAIGAREQKMLTVIDRYITHEGSLSTTQKKSYELLADTPVPTNWDINEFYKQSAATGGSEPWGPDGDTRPRSGMTTSDSDSDSSTP
jgi:hypothetical protein